MTADNAVAAEIHTYSRGCGTNHVDPLLTPGSTALPGLAAAISDIDALRDPADLALLVRRVVGDDGLLDHLHGFIKEAGSRAHDSEQLTGTGAAGHLLRAADYLTDAIGDLRYDLATREPDAGLSFVRTAAIAAHRASPAAPRGSQP